MMVIGIMNRREAAWDEASRHAELFNQTTLARRKRNMGAGSGNKKKTRQKDTLDESEESAATTSTSTAAGAAGAAERGEGDSATSLDSADVVALYMAGLCQNMVHSIRVHVEVMGVALLEATCTIPGMAHGLPDGPLMRALVARLHVYEHTPQLLCSYFVILGHIYVLPVTEVTCIRPGCPYMPILFTP